MRALEIVGFAILTIVGLELGAGLVRLVLWLTRRKVRSDRIGE